MGVVMTTFLAFLSAAADFALTLNLKAAIVAAGSRARLETLKAGIPVFYRDWTQNLDVMEQPDGRKFEVRFIAGAPRESNYLVIRELDRTAA